MMLLFHFNSNISLIQLEFYELFDKQLNAPPNETS